MSLRFRAAVLLGLLWAAASQECLQQTSWEHGLSTELHHDYKGNFGVSEVYNTIRGAGWNHLKPLADRGDQSATCGVLEPHEGEVAGRWWVAGDNHIVFEPHRCILRRLSAHSVRKCLMGKHIAYVGDR